MKLQNAFFACSRSLLLILFVAISACSTEPKIPDEQPTHEYKSTKKDADTTVAEKPKEKKLPHAVGPVAIIDGVEIPADYFNTIVNTFITKGLTKDQIANMKDSIVNSLIDDFLLKRKLDTLTYPVSEKVYNDRLADLKELVREKKHLPVGAELSNESIAKLIGLTEEDLEKSVRQGVQFEQELLQKGYMKPILDEEVKDYFDKHPEVSEVPELITARHILLKVPKEADEATWKKRKKDADAIAKLAKKKGADFAALAKEKSEGPTASNGGFLGTFPRNVMVPEFEQAVFKLATGKISDPIRTPFGWHIVLVEKHTQARKIPFAEAESKIRSHLRRAKASELLIIYVQDLRKDVKITLKPENIQ